MKTRDVVIFVAVAFALALLAVWAMQTYDPCAGVNFGIVKSGDGIRVCANGK